MKPSTFIIDDEYSLYNQNSDLLEGEDECILNNTYNEFLADDYPFFNRIIEKYSLPNLVEENIEETPVAVISYPE